ncbi:MAG: GAF domain-containing sensor histidine kinase [Gemmatimonadota bacterium]
MSSTLDGPDPSAGPAPRAAAAGERAALHAAERERDAAQASRDRFSFLAEVSRCLADSLDYEATLTTVAGMSLPYLDAWCIVDVLTEVGAIRRIAVLHPDAAKQDAARRLHLAHPPRHDDFIGAPRVIRSGRPEMVFDVPDAALAAAARSPEHLELLRTLGIRSYVIVPMVARGRTVGAITFVTAEAGRRFGDIDVVIAEDLARRAAMAVDNARLHGEALQARALAEEALDEAETATEQLREARDTAEAALRARSDFLSTMTHEVRTPINAIIGYLELIDLELAGGLTDTQRSYVQRARDSSRHLLRLVEDVLDLSKSEADRLAVACETVPASATALAALAVLRPQASGKLLTLTDDCAAAGELCYVGDEFRVKQVLINLLSNAIKFTPPGGCVALECGAGDGGWVVFRVRDTGVGVPPADAEAMFEPFRQGEAGLRRMYGGVGLGLSISRRLARLMGGDVAFEPPAGGEGGATFVLRMPAAPGADPGADGAVAGEEGPPAQPDSPGEDAVRRGLRAAGEALLRDLGRTVDDFVRCAREDETLAVTDRMTDVEIADHLSTLITDVANSLALFSQAGVASADLVDGSRIQRLIGELHGAQRQRLGWSETQLLREGELIWDVCYAAVVRAVGGEDGAAEAATAALSRLLQERVRACLSGFRAAQAGAS